MAYAQRFYRLLRLNITHLCQMDFSITTLWTSLFLIGCLVSFHYYCFIEIPVVDANSVDFDQMPHSTSDMGLHCLAITIWRAGG